MLTSVAEQLGDHLGRQRVLPVGDEERGGGLVHTTAIRSLIIDEEFGSLEADRRQRMIEELRALADHLDRIILVSHQDDFTDRTMFPTRFVLRKEGAQTVAERVG